MQREVLVCFLIEDATEVATLTSLCAFHQVVLGSVRCLNYQLHYLSKTTQMLTKLVWNSREVKLEWLLQEAAGAATRDC